MTTLILDTSCERGFVALAEKEKVVFEKRLSLGLFSSREAVKATHDLLAMSNLEISDLKAIAVGIGPGSFTSIRVGSAFALGLSANDTPPLITFSSLLGFTSEKSSFVSIIPARVGGLYGQLRKREGGKILEADSPRFFSPADYEKAFSTCELAVSPTLYSHPSFLISLVEREQDLSFIANYVESKYARKEFSKKELDILYLRPCPYST